jgi:uncharacterized membrane protein YheB (UPF0754 family)
MKKINGFKFLKWGLYLLFFLGMVFYVVSFFLLNSEGFWQELIFSVSLAGLIGIGTNTIAIEMLFHPIKKSFFGRQGILPANKESIAESLASTVREKIINETTIANYINDENKIKEISDKIVVFLENWIKVPENQEEIRGVLESVIKGETKEKIFEKFSDFLKELLVNYFSSENISFSKMFKRARMFFREKREENDPLFEKVVLFMKDIIIELVSENSDKISEFINKIIDDFISSKSVFSNIILSVGRSLFINEESVRGFVEENLNKKEKFEMMGNLVEEFLPELDRILEERENKEKLAEIYEILKAKLFYYLKEQELIKFVKTIEKKLEEIIEDSEKFEEFFKKINSSLVIILRKIFFYINYIKKIADTERLKNFLEKLKVGEFFYNIVKTNILSQDMEEFEKMMKKIMGDNLAYIEVIGGVLGGFIGLGLFYKPVLLIFPLFLVFFLSIELVLTKIIKKDSDFES